MPPRRTPTSALPLKHDVLLVLLALGAGPQHGFAIMQRIEEESDGAVVPQAGAFYRMVRNMLSDGLVEECADPAPAAHDGKPRRFYRLTRRGRVIAHQEVERLAGLVRLGRSRDLRGKPRSA
jgi:PadR family transcriptional regulator